MNVEQVSVFLKKDPSSLANITNILAGNGINIHALTLSDSGDYGVLRIIVNDTAKTVQILKENGYTARTRDVLALEVPDKPGGLASVLNILDEKGLAVEYIYAHSQKSGASGLIIFRIPELEEAERILREAGVRILSFEEICAF